MSDYVRKNNSLPIEKIRKPSTYDEFIYWLAMPTPAKMKMGIETQTQFAEFFKVSERTLLRWKESEQFRAQVRALRDKWAFEKTQGVIEGIYKAAVKGNDKSQKLWMQLFEGFTEKTEVEQTQKVEISVNDIRFLIEALPVQMQEKYYGFLQQLLDDSAAIARAIDGGDIPESVRIAEAKYADAQAAERNVPGDADTDAQHVPVERTAAMAESYPQCVCEDVVRQVSPHNHQSAARWWKK